MKPQIAETRTDLPEIRHRIECVTGKLESIEKAMAYIAELAGGEDVSSVFHMVGNGIEAIKDEIDAAVRGLRCIENREQRSAPQVAA